MKKIIITPAKLHGCIAAPPSKSHTHRLLVAAALSDAPCRVENAGTSADIEATAACLRALGAKVRREGDALTVEPIAAACGSPVLACGESGTTLRFMAPVAAALCNEVTLTGSGRLSQRPMEELLTAMAGHGTTASSSHVPLTLRGRLQPGLYELPGNVSSQYISGLLFALPLLKGESEIRLTTALSSSGYVAMTIDVLKQSGIVIEETERGFRVPGGQRYHAPALTRAEGDWSGSAFWLAAGAIGGPVTVTGLDPVSLHLDRVMTDLLRRFGAEVQMDPGGVTVSGGKLHGIAVDLDQIPDLALPLAVVAAFAEGETVFQNCGRLRLKESDRLAAIQRVLADFGVRTEVAGPQSDELHVFGGLTTECRKETPSLRETESFHDHRVVMMAAVLASGADGQTVISDPLCVAKSYPGFFEDFRALGGAADEI